MSLTHFANKLGNELLNDSGIEPELTSGSIIGSTTVSEVRFGCTSLDFNIRIV